jgi:Carboxypeptidase regulatory-like domain/TonB dependent receptor/TonB-dependent Receptor Plug Domain
MSRVACLLTAACLLVPGSVLAQARLTGSDLYGTVFDQSSDPVKGATVTVTNTETNQTRTAITDDRGHYLAAALPPGSYRVTVELTGFAPSVREVPLALGQGVRIDMTLTLAGGKEEVTVVGTAPVVDATHTAISSVVGQAQIESLPINLRNFLSFSIITPGVTNDRTPQQGASATSGLSFGGQRARSNNIMVDGLDNNDPIVGSVRATFSQEAIREFQVLTNSYSAEFGKASGGVVNIVTKSGTNELRGNAFVYGRDESLNARDHFEKVDVFGNAVDREKAPFSQYQWGGTLGGPLRKDRTFFFLSFEQVDIASHSFVTINPAAADVLRAAGFPVELGNVPWDFKTTEVLAKIDHQWSPNHYFVLRGNYSDTHNENVEPFGGITARSRGARQLREDWSIAASQTDIISPRWVNEARVQFAREDQLIQSLDPNCGGECLTNEQGGPTLEVTGVASVGRQRFTPQPRLNERIQVMDTVSFFGGNHSVKAGFDYNHVNTKETALPLHMGGRYIFASLPGAVLPLVGRPPQAAPISALEALSLGLPAAYVQGYGSVPGAYKDWDIALFLQDDWKVSNRLTLKAGVRYQRQQAYDLDYTVSMPGGSSLTYKYPQDNNNIAPRVALAYDPAGDGKTSIHAAYGIFYDNQILAANQIGNGINGEADGVRTLVLRFPASIAPWRAPGHKIPEPTTPYPSLEISPDPGAETPYAHQAAVGFDRALGQDLSVAANFMYVRGKHQLGTLDYNPIVPSLGAGRRPNDIGGRAGTSASILQYTSFGETWYKGMTLSVSKRLRNNYQFTASYTLSKAEDNSTDFQSAFIPQDNGQGRNPADTTGLPLGFDPDSERGPATHDQRHRFVFSGLYQFPWDLQLSTITTFASGRPFNILAGADLNGDGDGGAFPSDRARVNPADPASAVGRNAGTMKSQFIVDLRLSKKFRFGKHGAFEVLAEAFNLFDRTNFSEINNIFGRGAFPGEPQRDAQGRVTYGLYEQALAPRQVQLGAKISF